MLAGWLEFFGPGLNTVFRPALKTFSAFVRRQIHIQEVVTYPLAVTVFG